MINFIHKLWGQGAASLPRSLRQKRGLASLFIAALLVVLLLGSLFARPTPLYLAAVGPFSGAKQANGEQMLRGIELYLQRLNQQGGIQGHPVRLLSFDDQGDPAVAKRQAEVLSRDRRVLAVLGNYYSSTAIAAGEIYKQAKIPAITGSATAEAVTQDNEWYFRSLFSNQAQASFLAHYLSRILKTQQASLVYVDDSYGQSLAQSFEATFQGIGGTLKHRWVLPAENPEAQAQVQAQMIEELLQDKLQGKDLGALLIATPDQVAVPLVVDLKRNELTPLLLGPDSLGKESLSELFASYPEEQAEPGYFSDGLYAVAPIIFDVASGEAQDFQVDFVDRYGQQPTWAAATYYDAAHVVTEAMARAQLAQNRGSVQQRREKLREAIAQINNLSNAVKGLQGDLYFDGQGESLRAVPMGIFQDRQLIPAALQLQAVTDLRQVADLKTALVKGELLPVNSRYMKPVQVVYTGIDINAIDALDPKDSSYLVDFYLWFRYRGEFKADDIEFTNLAEPLETQELMNASDTPDELGPMHYRAYRVKGRFRGEFDFRDYPFDQQTLIVSFRHKSLKAEDLLYVDDVVGMRSNSTRSILSKLEQSKVLDGLPTWRIKSAKFFQDVLRDDSTLGDPQFLDAKFDDRIQYSRFNVAVYLQRDAVGFVLKNLLPVFLLLVAAYMILFIPADGIAPKAGGGLSILLATSFFHVRLSNDLPVVGYLVAIEYMFYAMYVLCLFALFVSIGTNVAAKRQNDQLLLQIDRLGKRFYPVALGVFVAIFTVIYGVYPLWSDRQLNAAPQPTQTPTLQARDLAAMDASRTTITLGSWRTEDQAEFDQLLAKFMAENPKLEVQFAPTRGMDYQTVLADQLAEGKAPDLFFVPPFSAGQTLIQQGALRSLNDFPKIEEITPAYDPEALKPWQNDAGELYALPMMAVSHGVYYNANLFKSLNLALPQTWEEFLATAQTLKAAGYIPLANSTQNSLSVAETLLFNLAPNFIGGRAGRLAYLSGDRCFNDPRAIATFKALGDLRPFLPDDNTIVTEQDSRQLLYDGKAAMMISGSWQIPQIEEAKPDFAWSVFAVPPPQGQPTVVTFQPDFAIGVNAASEHPEAAQALLQWLSQESVVQQLASAIPGFFPLRRMTDLPQDPAAQAFLKFTQSDQTDIRWTAEALQEGLPNGLELMGDSALGVLQGKLTPKQAADQVQRGLAQWFEPAQVCGQRGRAD